MSGLTGGVAPAFAKPDKNDPAIPIIPTEVVEPGAPSAPQEEAPAEQPRAKKEQPTGPTVDAPPEQPAAPRMQAPAPEKEPPRVVDPPKVDPPKVDPPKADAPKFDVPKADASKMDVPTVDAPKVNAPKAVTPKVDPPKLDPPKVETPEVDMPKVDAPTVDIPAPLPADQPVKAADPKPDAQAPGNAAPGQKPGEAEPDPSTVSKSAQRVAMAAPDTLQAPEQDIELARRSKPIEVEPEPAAKDDVSLLSSALNVSSKTKLGPFESEFNVGSDFSVGGDRNRDRDWDRDHDRDRDHDHNWDWDKKRWDKKVRQWDRRWIEYDDFYRPVIFNPFRAPVRIVYVYERAPRIVVVPPLGRVLVGTAALAAYSFTAVVLNAANLAADVAVGTFFGGGYIPPVGAPFIPPPPLTRYDNVPVQVRYSNATYEPFRVRQIVDVGDDVQYGGRKVLLDGATPAWGQWTTTPSGERQFEVHRTQQYPGLGEPQEAPLPGDYRMRLASDESAGLDRTQMYLMAAAGLVAGLGFGALGLAFYLGRRRRTL